MNRHSLLAIAAALLACGPSAPDAPPDDVDLATGAASAPFPLTPQQREGRVIFETVCWTCHGSAGRGDGPAVAAGSIPHPPSFQAPEYAGASGESLLEKFRTSLSGADPEHPHMQYVSSILRPDRFAAALAFIPALSYPREIPGSALAGEKGFAYRCSGCHGMSGRGDGPASPSLVLMPPADFTTDTLIAAKRWDAVYRRVREGGRAVHGSSMPPWGVALSEQDTWDLVAFLATFQPSTLEPPAWVN